ncbi:MAG TPA: ABC transporter permease [Chryseosolibacter sp.]
MLRSILAVTVRKIFRNPAYSLITTFGLTVGLTSAILVFLWAKYELTYDHYDSDNARIYTVLMNEMVEGSVDTYDETPVPLFEELSTGIPEVEAVTRFDNTRAQLKVATTEVIRYGVYADTGYFRVFKPEIVAGNVQQPLPDNHSIVISESLSRVLFADENALGKTVTVALNRDYTVSAVYRDFPVNSTLNYYSFVLPYNAKVRNADEWNNHIIKLQDTHSKEVVEKKIDAAVHTFMGNDKTHTLLFPLTDWRLYWNFENGKQSGGRIVYLVIFMATAFFILLMACVNYMNMATATAAQRAKEVGVRKMTGATQRSMVFHFFLESFLITMLAGLLSLIGVYLTKPLFEQLTGVQLGFSLFDPTVLMTVAGVSFLTAFIAGSYPAFLLARIKPVVTLKGNVSTSLTGAGLRKALVVFQFALSVILIFCALVMQRQTEFLLKKDLGFDKNNVINVWVRQDPNLPLPAFKSEIVQHASVVAAGYGGGSPMEINGNAEVTWQGKNDPEPMLLNGVSADHDMLQTLKFEFIAGRNFSPAFASDSSAFIITESAARKMGFKDPIGQAVTYSMFGKKEGTIIGVIRDFQNEDIHAPMDPVIFQMTSTAYMSNLFIRYQDGRLDEALAHIKSVFSKFQPGVALDYTFLDGDYQNQFFRERLLGNLSKWSTVIAISIAALGLLGLTMFTTQRRKKEIGVRKVLGATVAQIVMLLWRDFLRPVFISFVVAFPIAYLLAEKFLESYPFRISVSATLFLSVAALMTAFVLITVSFQSVRAALHRPGETLRNSE